MSNVITSCKLVKKSDRNLTVHTSRRHLVRVILPLFPDIYIRDWIIRAGRPRLQTEPGTSHAAVPIPFNGSMQSTSVSPQWPDSHVALSFIGHVKRLESGREPLKNLFYAWGSPASGSRLRVIAIKSETSSAPRFSCISYLTARGFLLPDRGKRANAWRRERWWIAELLCVRVLVSAPRNFIQTSLIAEGSLSAGFLPVRRIPQSNDDKPTSGKVTIRCHVPLPGRMRSGGTCNLYEARFRARQEISRVRMNARCTDVNLMVREALIESWSLKSRRAASTRPLYEMSRETSARYIRLRRINRIHRSRY